MKFKKLSITLVKKLSDGTTRIDERTMGKKQAILTGEESRM
ncbi:MAG: hypothetical protein Q4D62_16190 [Planctomycetia bacterium]|nr:hypothetical protein [Planctomycetia bacterium]